MTSVTPLDEVLSRARERGTVRQVGDEHKTNCPAHDDRHASLTIAEGENGRVIVKCFAGCGYAAIRDAYGLTDADFFSTSSRQVRRAKARAAAKHPDSDDGGLTLEQYATAKPLPVAFLKSVGLTDARGNGKWKVRISYRDRDGHETDVRYRHALDKGPDGTDSRFSWCKGATPGLYGLWRVTGAPSGPMTLAEGESDCHALWLHDLPALGVPGADTWKDAWVQDLEGFDPIYVVVEPDHGGDVFRAKLAASPLRDRLRLVHLGTAKDPSGLYLLDPPTFPTRWQAALDAAVPVTDAEQQDQADADRVRAEEVTALFAACRELAEAPDILARFCTSLHAHGLVGEDRVASLVYLAVVSRFLPWPVSIVVKGPSSAGKSWTVEIVIRHAPPEAVYIMSGLSEHALA